MLSFSIFMLGIILHFFPLNWLMEVMEKAYGIGLTSKR